MDTTSVALTILRPDPALVSSILDEMLEYVDADGIMQVICDFFLAGGVLCTNLIRLDLFRPFASAHGPIRMRERALVVLRTRPWTPATSDP